MCEGPVMAFDEVWWVCWVWWLGIYGIMTTGPDGCVNFPALFFTSAAKSLCCGTLCLFCHFL